MVHSQSLGRGMQIETGPWTYLHADPFASFVDPDPDLGVLPLGRDQRVPTTVASEADGVVSLAPKLRGQGDERDGGHLGTRRGIVRGATGGWSGGAGRVGEGADTTGADEVGR